MKKLLLITIVFICQYNIANAQNVGIGTNTPNTSAKLDITSTNSGILVPRVALTATNAAGPVTTPATSLLVYNTATSGVAPNNVTPGFYYWNGTAWTRILDLASNDWTLLGNAGTAPATNFIGTTDVVDFVTRTSNTERMRMTSAGNLGIGIGMTAPTNKVDISAAARSGTHGTGKPLYVSGTLAPGSAGSVGVEFRHDNGTQGIGFGYNTIYATGSNANQDLGMSSLGTGNLNYSTNGAQRMIILGSNGNIGMGLTNPTYGLELNGTFGYGNGTAGTYRSRTETRDNAGLIASQSGFFETSAPVNYPAGASGWWHLIDTRHSNNTNNFALQIAGSFFDQELWFRKTNNNAAQAWTRLLSTGNLNTYAWSILGNSGTVAATNFIGTTDAIDFVTRTSNTERMRVTSAGNVGIGTNAPAESFSVVRPQGGWQSRFNNSSGSGADVYLAHGAGYGMHIRGWNANDGIYTLEMYNNTTLTNAFYNSGRVALGMVGNVGVGVATAVYKFQTNGDIYANGGWFRVSGNQGYYFETHGGGWQMTDATWLRTYNAKPILATGGVAGYGNAVFGAPFGANPRFYANYDNVGGGGESISDDGGFYDYNDAWITFRGTQGMKIKHNVGNSDLMQFDMVNIGGTLQDRFVNSSNNSWGYVGINGRAWYYMYSYNFVNPSLREKKKDIAKVNGDISQLVMSDLDNLSPYFYRYKEESTEWVEGLETKCKPNFHLGLILDEVPDYLQDNAFSGVDIYSVATLGIVAAKENRNDIKEIKEELGLNQGATKKLSDFGQIELENGLHYVLYDETFASELNGVLPVITFSVNQQGSSATIVSKDAKGFKVQIEGAEASAITLDYIMMAKVKTVVSDPTVEDLEKSIPQDVLNGMRVSESSKERVKKFWQNNELEQKERERKAAEEAIIIQQQRKAEINEKSSASPSPSKNIEKQENER